MFGLSKDNQKITEVMIDKSSGCVVRLLNKSWLSCCSQAVSIIHGNVSKFKVFLKNLSKSFQHKHKATKIRKIKQMSF